MVRAHIFFDSLIPPKTLLKNRKRSETPIRIYKQMKKSMLIVRNLWIWRYSSLSIRLVKKLPICFPLSLSMIKSNIYTKDLTKFQACGLDESNEFGSSGSLLHAFHVIMLWNPRVLVNYSHFQRSGVYLPFGNHGSFVFIIVATNRRNTNCTRKTHSTTLSFHLFMDRNSQVAK